MVVGPRHFLEGPPEDVLLVARVLRVAESRNHARLIDVTIRWQNVGERVLHLESPVEGPREEPVFLQILSHKRGVLEHRRSFVEIPVVQRMSFPVHWSL